MSRYAIWVNGRFGGYKMCEREGSRPPIATFETAEAAEAAIIERGFISSTFADRLADGRTRLRPGQVTAYVILTDTKFLG